MSRITPIRTAARAVIICDGKLLVAKMRDHRGIYYILPGGGQLPGETLHDTVRRECLEEVGVEVTIERLLYIREYIGKNHNFSPRHANFHQLESVFLCNLKDPHAVKSGHEIDNHQIGVSWLSLDNIQNIRFYPEAVKDLLAQDLSSAFVQYLGDCN